MATGGPQTKTRRRPLRRPRPMNLQMPTPPDASLMSTLVLTQMLPVCLRQIRLSGEPGGGLWAIARTSTRTSRLSSCTAASACVPETSPKFAPDASKARPMARGATVSDMWATPRLARRAASTLSRAEWIVSGSWRGVQGNVDARCSAYLPFRTCGCRTVGNQTKQKQK
jgi:hypothetical protein